MLSFQGAGSSSQLIIRTLFYRKKENAMRRYLVAIRDDSSQSGSICRRTVRSHTSSGERARPVATGPSLLFGTASSVATRTGRRIGAIETRRRISGFSFHSLSLLYLFHCKGICLPIEYACFYAGFILRPTWADVLS